MAKITISDLAISPVYESFITELDQNIINGIIGGDCDDVKFRKNGKVKRAKGCSSSDLTAILKHNEE
ncbi:MAG: hypothetical protein F6J90_05600 [Moorea sp. SIOASIH]|uniref:hypothetical protein n=1 Tax=Moorena sp. SIOASIH TaxID=2607817 RepID=UPI0013B5FC16|nr:hypothetical protein [Moorena sp. SIOASIH]NEO35826.1 hypothetical protein [Moorena sp. SIOASIH]